MKRKLIPIFVGLQSLAVAQSNQTLSLETFVQTAMVQDTEFKEILIEELELAYQHDLRMPARDLVLSVQEEYVNFFKDSRGDSGTLIGLNKAFPNTATEVDLEYRVDPSNSADRDNSSSLSLSFSQAIARNAFGRSTRLLEQLIGLEVEVARHQIIEAYEDYLAGLMGAYFEWWSAYENLLISEKSYNENTKLLANMLDREKQQVALPIDVNKVRLQLLGKKEDLVTREGVYKNTLEEVKKALRVRGVLPFIPLADSSLRLDTSLFENTFEQLRENSRTFNILALLEERSGINLDRATDDLLPSIDLLFGLETDGEDHNLNNSESLVSLGIRLRWPFPNQVSRAERDVAALRVERSQLTTGNTEQRLETRLRNIFEQIDRERKLKGIAEEQIRLAQAIVTDETENYSYGRVTLNDYIRAVNVVDNSRFSRLRRATREKILIIEWLRLADRLVARADEKVNPTFKPVELEP